MKNTLSLLITLILVSMCACSAEKLYVGHIASDSYTIERADNGDFVEDRADLWTAYCFNGFNSPIRVTVFNKSDKPLYVDWAKSTITINNDTYSYIEDYPRNDYIAMFEPYPAIFDKEGQPSENEYPANLPEYTDVISPGKMISFAPISLKSTLFDNISATNYNQEKAGIKKADFSESDSPLRISIDLHTFQDSKDKMLIKNSFYLSTLLKAKSEYCNILEQTTQEKGIDKDGDLFYIHKPANKSFENTVLGGVALAGLIYLFVATDGNVAASDGGDDDSSDGGY